MILHFPMTVGDTLESVPKDADALVVVFRNAETGAWRIGWSKMDLPSLCYAKEILEHEIQQWIGESFVAS